jgi:hypothetical protein
MIVWALFVVVIICFVVTCFWLAFSTGKKTSNGSENRDAGPADINLLPPPKSPLMNVSFKTALEGNSLAHEIGEFGREALNYSLAGQGANFIVQSMEFAKHSRSLDITYRFTNAGYRQIAEGSAIIPTHTATGQWLPELQDRHGRITELAKGSKDVLGKLANLSSLVVATAHIIVSIDTLRRKSGSKASWMTYLQEEKTIS